MFVPFSEARFLPPLLDIDPTMNFSVSSPTSTDSSYYQDSVGSRPSSTSPRFAATSLVSKFRQDATRGFDPDDDVEFCPAFTRVRSMVNERSHAENFAPAVYTPVFRPRKALDIINPSTGLRVGSPKAQH